MVFVHLFNFSKSSAKLLELLIKISKLIKLEIVNVIFVIAGKTNEIVYRYLTHRSLQ